MLGDGDHRGQVGLPVGREGVPTATKTTSTVGGKSSNVVVNLMRPASRFLASSCSRPSSGPGGAPRLKGLHPATVNVDVQHLMADLGQAQCGYEAKIAGPSHHADVHVVPLV